MLHSESSLRLARNDTLLDKAPEESLRTLSNMYALRWIDSSRITLEAQRAFLKSTVYGARGTYSGFFSSVRSFFSYAEIEVNNVTFSQDDVSLSIESTEFDVSWSKDRFIEITRASGKKELHRSFALSGNTISLSLNRTASHLGDIEGGNTIETVSVTLLPFRLTEPQPAFRKNTFLEKPCTVILELSEDATIPLPVSYYRENGDARTTDPQGLHIRSLSEPSYPNTSYDPYPLYYYGEGEISEYIRTKFSDLLNAGVHLEFYRRSF
jgi:hypothetical protein